jgi:hypothetical protein
MEEQLPALSGNEPKPFVRDHFLDRSLRHDATPAKKRKNSKSRKLLLRNPSVKEDCGQR